MQSLLRILLPLFALLYALAIVALFFVVGKGCEQLTRENIAQAAMEQLFFFTTHLYGTCLAPEGFCYLQTALAVHLGAVGAGLT